MSNIIEQFISELEQFNTKYTSLSEWLRRNEKAVETDLKLTTIVVQNEQLKNILNTGISLQTDLTSLREHLQTIALIIKNFEESTENTDGGKSTMILKQLQQNFDFLSNNYIDFIKRCKQILDTCEHYMIMFNEINHVDQEFIKLMNEFDQQLAKNENNSQVRLEKNLY